MPSKPLPKSPKKRTAAPSKKKAPTRYLEQELQAAGHEIVVGIDEVGRGAWAGPLMVGAAVLPADTRVLGVRDSKMLSEVERERLFDRVAGWCTTWAVGGASQEECDELGMAAAQKLATQRAIEGLSLRPDAAIVDGKWDFVRPHVRHVEMKIKADAYCLSVAAASILAKVTRDRIMREMSSSFPHWHFDTNKGYPCPLHKTALLGYGASSIHRKTWVFMDNYVPWPGLRVTKPEQPTLF
jgi:ribonuclease HII